MIYNLYDKYDQATKNSSMARTTGYTCNAALHLFINNLFKDKGVFPPELVGKNEQYFRGVLKYLKERKVIYKKTEVA